jgi:aromatic-amino-acid transaminase
MSGAMIVQPSPFATLSRQAPDALLGLIAQYAKDERSSKIDLGVGVYRDEAGRTPVMRSVKAAEQLLVRDQPSKSYLGGDGDAVYTALLADIVLGPELSRSDRLVGIQTPGGTGALRLGAEIIARARPGATVWLSDPTWPNHNAIFGQTGLRVRIQRFYDPRSLTIDFDGMIEDLDKAKQGDVILLHGCCHNPTGASFTGAQWQQIADLCEVKGLLPFIDLAYQGLGHGLEEDARATRRILEQLPHALLAYSCDKNFGLYRERVGALWLHAPSAAIADAALSNMLSLARVLWSMPPDHGAAIVRTILETPELCADWSAELDVMRDRINTLRTALAKGHPALAPVGSQTGMFALLPLTPSQVGSLRTDNGIYMAGNGRINICGLTLETIPSFVSSLIPYLPVAGGR